MKKKIICITIVSIIFLLSVNAASKSTNELKETDEIKKEIKTKISNVEYNDCPYFDEESNLDPNELIWYPGKCIVCTLLFMIGAPWALVRNLIDGELPLGFIAIGQALGCWWAEWA